MQFTPVHFTLEDHGTPLPDGRFACHFAPAGEPPSNYVYEQPLVLAINVALATRRPLLLAGEPGCGKTTLARNIALVRGWAYYQHTIASRSQAAELLWELDTLRRLADAYDPQQRVQDEDRYVEPGMLWWALAPVSAARRGLPPGTAGAAQPPRPPKGHREAGGAVLLIDEIDKAEPDVPNDLLEVLDTGGFSVKGRAVERERASVLVIITTNVERDLPGAFMRRCVTYRFPEAPPGWFRDIGLQRLPQAGTVLAQKLEDQLRGYRDTARRRGERVPGTAEYLDALAALVALQVGDGPSKEGVTAWDRIEQSVFGKQAALEGGRAV